MRCPSASDNRLPPLPAIPPIRLLGIPVKANIDPGGNPNSVLERRVTAVERSDMVIVERRGRDGPRQFLGQSVAEMVHAACWAHARSSQ